LEPRNPPVRIVNVWGSDENDYSLSLSTSIEINRYTLGREENLITSGDLLLRGNAKSMMNGAGSLVLTSVSKRRQQESPGLTQEYSRSRGDNYYPRMIELHTCP
jgi:hypothetical protein